MKELGLLSKETSSPGTVSSIPSHSFSLILRSHARSRCRRLTSFSPPYTPPPILSPSRSMTMLPATPQVALPCTPNKIWQRKGKQVQQLSGFYGNVLHVCIIIDVLYHNHTCIVRVVNDVTQLSLMVCTLRCFAVFLFSGSERVSESEDSFSYAEP